MDRREPRPRLRHAVRVAVPRAAGSAARSPAPTTARLLGRGFPLGYALTATKAEEAAHLVELGCREVDMVINIAALLEGDDDFVLDDIARGRRRGRATRAPGRRLVKVILETGYLEEADIVLGCRFAVKAGAAFVKTSTGFGPRGASVARRRDHARDGRAPTSA